MITQCIREWREPVVPRVIVLRAVAWRYRSLRASTRITRVSNAILRRQNQVIATSLLVAYVINSDLIRAHLSSRGLFASTSITVSIVRCNATNVIRFEAGWHSDVRSQRHSRLTIMRPDVVKVAGPVTMASARLVVMIFPFVIDAIRARPGGFEMFDRGKRQLLILPRL